MTDGGPWNTTATAPRSQKKSSINWREICCGTAAVLIFLSGAYLASAEDSWSNERVSGLLQMLGSAVLAPPILETIRRRFRYFRPVAAPVFYAILLGPVTVLAGLPFTPSAAEQLRLQTVAMARANALLSEGKPLLALISLRKFNAKRTSDPKLATLFARIDTAMKPAPSVTKPAREITVAAQPAAPPTIPAPPVAAKMEGAVSPELSAQVYLASMAALQERMNDPTSLLITGNKVLWEKDAKQNPVLRNYVQYRGTNAFGGVVTERAIITLGPDGKTVIGIQKVPTS
jgi:hypothetical protein